jgi:hypothetical protein
MLGTPNCAELISQKIFLSREARSQGEEVLIRQQLLSLARGLVAVRSSVRTFKFQSQPRRAKLTPGDTKLMQTYVATARS